MLCTMISWARKRLFVPAVGWNDGPGVVSGPSPNIVSSVGSGPQFAGASGTGTQVANAVSGPGLPQQGTGTSSPIPDIFNTPGFTDGGFSDFSGKRRHLSQALAGSSATSFPSEHPLMCFVHCQLGNCTPFPVWL